MVDLRPFKGLRYNPEKADLSAVTAPPYDVIDRHFHDELYARSEYNAVRIDLNKKENGDTPQNNSFTRAANFLNDWQQQGVLKQDGKPCVYAYSQSWVGEDGTRIERKGVVALLKIEDYAARKVLPHEQTLKGPIADRLMLMKATMANLSQIFMIYGDPTRMMEKLLFDEAPKNAEWLKATDDGGVEHRFRPVDDENIIGQLQKLFADKSVLIADGHHRYETALAFKRDVRERLHQKTGESHAEGDLPSDYLMVFLANLDDPGLLVLPTDRVLYKWPEGWDAGRFEKALFERYEKTSADKADFSVHIAGNGGPMPVKLKDAAAMKDTPDLLKDFDTAILEETVFKGILGQESQQAMKNKHLLGFYRDPAYVKKLVDNGEAVAVFGMGTPPVALVKKICEAGYLMPQKSTYFYPKILTGLVFYSYQLEGLPALFGPADLDPAAAISPE